MLVFITIWWIKTIIYCPLCIFTCITLIQVLVISSRNTWLFPDELSWLHLPHSDPTFYKNTRTRGPEFQSWKPSALLGASGVLKTSICNMVESALFWSLPSLHDHCAISDPWWFISAASSYLEFPVFCWVTPNSSLKIQFKKCFFLEASSGLTSRLSWVVLLCVPQC